MDEPDSTADLHTLEVDASARISWGHDPETVAAFLRSRGVPPDRIRRVIDAALEERDELFRRKGIRDLALAGFVGAIGLSPMVLIAWEQGINEGLKGLRPPCLLMVFAGLWLAARGVSCLVMGGKGEGPISAPDPVFDKIAQLILGLLVFIAVIVAGVFLVQFLR